MMSNKDLYELATGVMQETMHGSTPQNTVGELAAGVIRLADELEKLTAYVVDHNGCTQKEVHEYVQPGTRKPPINHKSNMRELLSAQDARDHLEDVQAHRAVIFEEFLEDRLVLAELREFWRTRYYAMTYMECTGKPPAKKTDKQQLMDSVKKKGL